MTTSLIISTYNWPEALHLVLQSVLKQSVLPNEIIIADDGSKEDTKELVETFIAKNPHLKVIHVWQEDDGFQKSMILNKSIKKVTSDYIIQVDGDCILSRNFIKDHMAIAKENFFICGNRVYTTKWFTRFMVDYKAKLNFITKIIGTKFHFKYQYRNPSLSKKKSIVHSESQDGSITCGCNLSYWKSDAHKINGYSEDFVGWGPEDIEFAARLLNNNIKLLQVKHACILYHLFHKESSKKMLERNSQLLAITRTQRLKHTKNGLQKYS